VIYSRFNIIICWNLCCFKVWSNTQAVLILISSHFCYEGTKIHSDKKIEKQEKHERKLEKKAERRDSKELKKKGQAETSSKKSDSIDRSAAKVERSNSGSSKSESKPATPDIRLNVKKALLVSWCLSVVGTPLFVDCFSFCVLRGSKFHCDWFLAARLDYFISSQTLRNSHCLKQ